MSGFFNDQKMAGAKVMLAAKRLLCKLLVQSYE